MRNRGPRSDFFPVVLSFMRQLPVIGHFLSAPGVRQVRVGSRGLVASKTTLPADEKLSPFANLLRPLSQMTDRLCGVRKQSPV